MKKSIYIIALFVLCGFFSIEKTTVHISNASEIIIKGKSNVNSFQCEYDKKLIASNLTVTHFNKDNKTILEGATFLISSKGFDCAHKMISNDLKSVLKADDYSHIKIDVLELKVNNNKAIAVSKITIAGVERKYEIPVEINGKTKNVTGNLVIDIKDFKLKTPKKLLGLIKLEDTVTIMFNLYLKY